VARKNIFCFVELFNWKTGMYCCGGFETFQKLVLNV